MTPQILLDALRKAFVSLDIVQLMILDECHRATGNHPYSVIMTVVFFLKLSFSDFILTFLLDVSLCLLYFSLPAFI